MLRRMLRMLWWWFFFFFFCLLLCNNCCVFVVSAAETGADAASTAATATDSHTNNDDYGSMLISWFVANGGILHPALSLHHVSGKNYAMFADQDIPFNTVLLQIPKNITLTSPSLCQTVLKLAQELDKHDDKTTSTTPYVQYLKATQTFGELPAFWSDEGQELLLDLLAVSRYNFEDDEEEDEDFRPSYKYYAGSRHLHKLRTPFVRIPPDEILNYDLQQECSDEDEEYEIEDEDDITENMLFAYQLVLQRGWDETLVPIFDMMSHQNGPGLNTAIPESLHATSSPFVQVLARRDIQAGEEIVTTYNFCEDCANRYHTYGTPEIFRDYGFIEAMPQRWVIPGGVSFDLDYNVDDIYDQKLQATWIPGERSEKNMFPAENDIVWMEQQIERLEWWKQHRLSHRPDNIPQLEWDLTCQYHSAFLQALQTAVAQTERIDENCSSTTTTTKDRKNEQCDVSYSKYYDSLETEADTLPYPHYTCDAPYNFPEYQLIDSQESAYQLIEIHAHPETNDACLKLDDTWQICGNYRPHYHELMVDYTARYIHSSSSSPEEETKKLRVAFVGGGDSMLLHELLHFSPELVVGLELDQVVTRQSFQHFGTQPHWDDTTHVQWWFGDAAKSLLMLPSDYFGSFDMVLMDLSETVMAMTVNEGLDIFGALALLLKPNGVIVKNEFYLEKFSEIFDYTVQIHMYDVPTLCSQVFLLGSYENDFLKQVPINHKIPTMIEAAKPYVGDDRYDIWHDYRHNVTSIGSHCPKEKEKDKEPTEQLRSPGILMILEAENTQEDLSKPDNIKDKIIKSLENEGFKVVSSLVQEQDDDDDDDDDKTSIITVVMDQGYIVARLWPDKQYCAFDIHLWSTFDKHEQVKDAMLKQVVGSNTDSAYRIVAGGMFGVVNWKLDEERRGPPRSAAHGCENDKKESGTDRTAASADAETYGKMVQEGLSLVNYKEEKDILVAVVCGQESESCLSIDEVSKLSQVVSKVVPLRLCPSLKGINMYSPESGKLMQACQLDLLKTLETAVKENNGKGLRAIILDESAPYLMGQLIHKIFKRQSNRKKLLTDDILLLGTVVGKQNEWKRNLLERFRRDIIIHEPVFRAEILLNTTDSMLEWGILSSGDAKFIEHLTSVIEAVESTTSRVADIRNIQGGLYRMQENFTPSVFALPRDYDPAEPLKQWKSQEPLGLQIVFQYEASSEIMYFPGDRVKVSYEDMDVTFLGTIEEVNDNGSLFIQYDDGDVDEAVSQDIVEHVDSERKRLTASDLSGLESAFKDALEENDVTGEVKAFRELGDGSLFSVLWDGGNAMVLWDGREHVDMNIFTFEEDFDLQKSISDSFQSKVSLMPTLRDEQPRGRGRVVNFKRDLEPEHEPLWA